MREELVEELVKCKTNVGLTCAKFALYGLCVVAALAAMMGFGLAPFVIAVLCGAGGYYVGMKSQVEYEYTYCNKGLDIDVIYCQSTRKHVMSLELDKMEALVRVEGSKMREYANRQCAVKDFSSKNKENADKVYALFYDGNIKLLIEPGERMLNAISYVAPRKIYKD